MNAATSLQRLRKANFLITHVQHFSTSYHRVFNLERIVSHETFTYVFAVWKAAAYGDFDALKRSADEDPALVNTPDEQGYFCIQWAALNNRVAIITYLIDLGCDLNAVDATGQSALHWSVVRGSIPALETLLRAGADLNSADSRGYTVCHVAAQYGQTAALYHLAMKWGAETDGSDNDGRTPLHWAAYKGYSDTTRLLLVMGSRPNLQDKEGCTPLHWSAIRGNSEACTVLLQGGALDALEQPDATGATPSQLAIDKGHRLLGVNLAEYRYRKDRNKPSNGFLAALSKLHLSPIIWGIVLGMLGMLVYTVITNPYFPPVNSGLVTATWLTFALAFVGLYFLFKTTTADPGFLPRHTAAGVAATRRTGSSSSGKISINADLERGDDAIGSSLNSPALWAGQWSQLCVSCKIVRPLRAKHCSVTGRCVECFDHYCPWVGNAIGKGNRHLFVIFLWLELGAVIMSAGTALVRIHSAVTKSSPVGTPEVSGLGLAMPVIFVVFDFFLLISVAALAIAQGSQVWRNVTTNELANWNRYKYLQAPDGDFENPFDHGCKANCVEVCMPEKAQMAPYVMSAEKGLSTSSVNGTGEQELLLKSRD